MDHKRQANYRGPDLKLYIRDVRDRQGKKRPITVRSWATVKDVKDTIQQLIHVQASAQRLYFGPLLTSGKELPNHRTLHDAGIHRSGETLLLDIKGSNTSPDGSMSSLLSNSKDLCISSSMLDSTPKALRNLVQEARRGFALGLKPDMALEGSGGTYFLHDSRKNKIGVFKPADEEPYADNNPRGYLRQQPGDSLREGIVPGEACIREVAAYLLDHGGFAGVPMTTLAEARHPAFNSNGSKLNVSQGGAAIGAHSFVPPNSPAPHSSALKKAGSFQEFVRCECTIDDVSPSKISVEEIHKIAILDIRIMNADRNAANLLIRRRTDNSLELVPIDHGYCLRSVCDVSWMDWCWLDWPQLKEPLSETHRKYVENLDIEADAQMLRERLNICEEAVDYFRASSALLKAGVAAGLTLYDIAILCCRNDNLAEVPSMMEKLFDMAAELAHVAVENERYHHTAASRALVEQLCPTRRRCSMLGSAIPMHSHQNRMYKSASSGEFLTIAHRNTSDNSLSNQESPGMIQSSASDTSSDAGDQDASEEKEDCEEWAAKVIADVSMDQITPIVRPHRSVSIASDDASSDSDSKNGFWCVPPGAADDKADSEDGSVAWSTDQSPRNSFLASWSFDNDNLIDDHDDFDEYDARDYQVGSKFKTPTVTFAETTEKSFLPPATVSVSGLKSLPPALKHQESVMTRSKSYSGLSDKARPRNCKDFPLFNKCNQEDTYKKYFHKFIDLVIVRETTAALHHSRHGNNTEY